MGQISKFVKKFFPVSSRTYNIRMDNIEQKLDAIANYIYGNNFSILEQKIDTIASKTYDERLEHLEKKLDIIASSTYKSQLSDIEEKLNTIIEKQDRDSLIMHKLNNIDKMCKLPINDFPRFFKENQREFLDRIASINSELVGKNGKVGYAIVAHRTFQGKDHLSAIYEKIDLVRYGTLELLINEIAEKNIPGEVAEVGVFQGDFAQVLNMLLPQKKLYLFDTFEGFIEQDCNIDIQNNYSKADQDFSNTSEESVLSRMMTRSNCFIKKGRFPETAIGIEDKFCLVSLDSDLFQPTYEGLKYFYPRLSHGGYIFLHDYSSYAYLGVKEALRRFSEETSVPYSIVPDLCGSAVIAK